MLCCDRCSHSLLSLAPPCAAVDRSVTASLSDARDALTNAAIDSLTSYRQSVLTIQQPGLLAPACLRLFPLFVLALLKQVGNSIRAPAQSPRPFHQSTKCSSVPTESLPDRHQHPAGRPGLLHVPAEVPAAGLLHADDPPCPLPSGRSH